MERPRAPHFLKAAFFVTALAVAGCSADTSEPSPQMTTTIFQPTTTLEPSQPELPLCEKAILDRFASDVVTSGKTRELGGGANIQVSSDGSWLATNPSPGLVNIDTIKGVERIPTPGGVSYRPIDISDQNANVAFFAEGCIIIINSTPTGARITALPTKVAG